MFFYTKKKVIFLRGPQITASLCAITNPNLNLKVDRMSFVAFSGLRVIFFHLFLFNYKMVNKWQVSRHSATHSLGGRYSIMGLNQALSS